MTRHDSVKPQETHPDHECSPGCTHMPRHEDPAAIPKTGSVTFEQLQRARPSCNSDALLGTREDRERRILLRGGTILSMDTQVGDFAKGDVLLVGKKIAEVAPRVEADALIVDAEGMIVLPGFCDPHIHAWQGNLARLIPDNVSTPEEEMGGAWWIFTQRAAIET